MRHAIIICTKNREEDVIKLLLTIKKNDINHDFIKIIIGDSTEPEKRFNDFKYRLFSDFPTLNIQHFFHLGGLPSARNACIQKIENEDLIHFFDDDVTIPTNYFSKIEEFLEENPNCSGGGPRIHGLYTTQSSGLKKYLKRILGLEVKFGRITQSGRHYWVPDTTDAALDVEWIPGCSMFYKREIFNKFTFNATMENGPGKNYALGEDLDFSHRVSKVFSLKSIGELTVVHHQAPSKRDNWLLIAKASGAQYSYLLRAFPDEFNSLKIHLGRFLDFIIMNRPINLKAFTNIYAQYLGYIREFKRENKEQLINLDQQKKP